MTHAQDDLTHPDLAKAFAAFFATLIAAIAQLAAEQPLLAPSLRMSIRQIEKIARQFEAMATEWQATRHRPKPRRPRFTPPHRAQAKQAKQAIHMETERRREANPSLRLPFAMRNPAAIARAPPPGLRPASGQRAEEALALLFASPSPCEMLAA
jgi:hypothetical protein